MEVFRRKQEELANSYKRLLRKHSELLQEVMDAQ